jgi:hypothetical protein
MERKNSPEDVADRDDRGWEEGEALDDEPVVAGPSDPDDEVGVAGDEDLDEIDAPIDPDFGGAGAWELEALELDDDDDSDDTEEDEAFDDEAEMHLLHELGIDLDAPDGEAGLDLSLDIDQEDPADDGVAA